MNWFPIFCNITAYYRGILQHITGEYLGLGEKKTLFPPQLYCRILPPPSCIINPPPPTRGETKMVLRPPYTVPTLEY